MRRPCAGGGRPELDALRAATPKTAAPVRRSESAICRHHRQCWAPEQGWYRLSVTGWKYGRRASGGGHRYRVVLGAAVLAPERTGTSSGGSVWYPDTALSKAVFTPPGALVSDMPMAPLPRRLVPPHDGEPHGQTTDKNDQGPDRCEQRSGP